ncbi:MAG: response regulator transcription factor [Acidobacteria bacterium]|nr:response regulator transcription factor [Acidobacteriota bacterium]
MKVNDIAKHQVGLCETHPAAAEGVRSLLAATEDMECAWVSPALIVAVQMARHHRPSALLLDKALGQQAVLTALQELKNTCPTTGAIVWGTSMSEAEALRLLKAGARGLLRKSSGLETIETCLRTVANGSTWLEDCVFRDTNPLERAPRSDLTIRESQVLELVEQGLRNKDIASTLGIRPGTVKIHLKHIFEKTGVHGRYGLALNGLRERGLLSASRAN